MVLTLSSSVTNGNSKQHSTVRSTQHKHRLHLYNMVKLNITTMHKVQAYQEKGQQQTMLSASKEIHAKQNQQKPHKFVPYFLFLFFFFFNFV